ncbi:NAD dependent epimerase/dehydratase family protein [Croceitalea dokdonensis DOKDO 023]|uniref:NAD dependent epimerase/dehydratase family protein n=1 Tax=Croceitalea dokdonensis DOKDO 023 TaxID=1300341 RepID=A0A0P7AL27_9FLAO|nr:TIGR01777 family oxidoreductase [Croceitalea dokdonensis]KPM32545.1 NAD dependent epimerase/dehydratase family protein [Croceitalea dokdonensis DOKDO 023]
MKKLVVAGGSGFLGNAIVDHFKTKFEDIVVLTRNTIENTNTVRYVSWDAKTLGHWQCELDGCDVLINMAGRSVDCRYTAKNKHLIMDSRVDSTRVLNQAVAMATDPPHIWLNSSTATIYRHSLDMEMDEEQGEIGTGFSVSVAQAWEAAFFSGNTPKTRKVALRTSIVMGKNGGALTPIRTLAKMGLGRKQGNGKQKFSWIHVDDFVRSIEFIITNSDLHGPINIVAPKPTTNTKLMETVRNTMGISLGLPSPKWLLAIGARIIRTEPELVLKSRNVVPKKLLTAGFDFKYGDLDHALKSVLV